MQLSGDDSQRFQSPEMTGTLTVACVRGSDPMIDVSRVLLASGAVNVESKGVETLAWFQSARKALRVAVGLVESSPDGLSAGIATGDIENDLAGLRLIEEAEGASGLCEAGQILVTLGTQELVRNSLKANESFSDIGTRPLGASAVPTRLFILIAPGLRSDGSAGNVSRGWNSTRFIGRRREIDEIIRLLEESRLVTIYGPSGIGKSSLAARIAVEVQDQFAEGSIWLDLATVRRSGVVLHRIAQGLDIHSLHEATLFDQIVRRIGEKNVLLIFDSVDHVQDELSPLLEPLIQRCLNVAVLVTASRRCATPSESAFALGGLDMPTGAEPPEAMLEYDAVRCFVEAARSVEPGFTIDSENAGAIASIADAVDGSPLGIQMAASRIAILTPHQILTRLRKDPLTFLGDGNRASSAIENGMRATLLLLSPTAQKLFARLNVFHGPFSAESIEAVCTDKELPKDAVLSSLRELVEVQFVQRYKATRLTRAFYLA
ncbi:MAG TPA: NACHT domain-containing protein, partial [Fimbriimonas sp.]|nr:NACHT domain-containing protein [Fimbriimonas sp.]